LGSRPGILGSGTKIGSNGTSLLPTAAIVPLGRDEHFFPTPGKVRPAPSASFGQFLVTHRRILGPGVTNIRVIRAICGSQREPESGGRSPPYSLRPTAFGLRFFRVVRVLPRCARNDMFRGAKAVVSSRSVFPESVKICVIGGQKQLSRMSPWAKAHPTTDLRKSADCRVAVLLAMTFLWMKSSCR
jgi:hypothetical protein